MRNFLKGFTQISVTVLMIGCTGSKTDQFPMNKPYWDAKDYDNALLEIEFQTPKGEKYPTLSDPETVQYSTN